MKLKFIYFIPFYGLWVYLASYYKVYYLAKEYNGDTRKFEKQLKLLEAYHFLWLHIILYFISTLIIIQILKTP